MVKLGSLFSGSGGFELAGAINGIEPVWASEIEPYPIKVTTARFPDMKHLGDVTKINGAEVDPVDIITFGSPCQDLSVAGKREGLEGGRSNLFYEAIRIIKEMRNATNNIYPRIAVWENVPGAFSSNKGEDFRAVLQAFVRLREQTADVPMPQKGKWANAGCIVGNGYSVAWRTLDAQYNGVPQRRRRIYLVADFGSERAGEVLFEPQSVRGHPAQSGTAGEGTADNAEGSAGRSGFNGIFFKERAGCPGGGKGILCGDKPFTLSTMTDQAVCYPIDSHQQDSRSYTAGNGQINCKYIIRRLTPLETCRLQGFPDWWEDGVQGSDSARYKMWGNGIALPNAIYVVGCAKRLIQGGNHDD